MQKQIDQLHQAGITLSLKVSSFSGNHPIGGDTAAIRAKADRSLVTEQANWHCSLDLQAKAEGCLDAQAVFDLTAGEEPCGNAAVVFDFTDWSTNNYVLMPAAAYQGNRFRIIPGKYPPFLHEEDGIGPDMPITTTDVPHLNAGDGPSQIHLRSGDMATPCVGIFRPERQQGILLFFEPITAFGYTGVKLSEALDRTSASLTLEAPAVRETMYTMMRSDVPSDDRGAAFAQGDRISLRFRLILFACPDVSSLFRMFFDHRKDLAGSPGKPDGMPLSAAFRIIEQKYNRSQWNDRHEYYQVGPEADKHIYEDWQAGWCGGGLNALAFSYDGLPVSRDRADRTMDAIFSILQTPQGYILPVFWQGKPMGDDFRHPEWSQVLLIRKNADVLTFAARYILLRQQRGQIVSDLWLKGLRALADAFVRIWQRHGQFGQFIDTSNDDILQGGTACGSMIPCGLALAWRVLGEEIYLQTAESSAQDYYRNFVSRGILNGGPGEILQNPDSESASNMLESFVVLYELTGKRDYIGMAEETAWICASWQVSYDFVFPAESAFGQMNMHTTGSVYANVQNKHSAPGFCTLSGASLLRLFRATGDRRYLMMAQDVARGITQYLSREDRPVPAWDGRLLPAGWMCERVNMSDWEGKKHIGGVFYGSCWCEISCLLTYAEFPGVLFLGDTGEAIVFDQVDVTVSDAGDNWQLVLRNATPFAAAVKVMAEASTSFGRPWDPCVTDRCRIVEVPAMAGVSLLLPKLKCPRLE